MAGRDAMAVNQSKFLVPYMALVKDFVMATRTITSSDKHVEDKTGKKNATFYHIPLVNTQGVNPMKYWHTFHWETQNNTVVNQRLK